MKKRRQKLEKERREKLKREKKALRESGVVDGAGGGVDGVGGGGDGGGVDGAGATTSADDPSALTPEDDIMGDNQDNFDHTSQVNSLSVLEIFILF